MKILVTGGAGFIGSHFVDLLLSEESAIQEVVVIDKLTYAGDLNNLASAKMDRRFRFILGDIAKPDDVELAIQGITHIVNFAAESHVDRSINNPDDFFKTNILGTSVLLDVAKRHNILKFIQVSTDEVYGSIEEGSWDENSQLLPNSPYSASKAAADLIVRSYFVTFGLNINITRCSNNYGPRQFPEKLIPFFIDQLLSDKAVPIYGSGLNRRDWLHVTDHCLAILQVLRGGRAGEIYNIGGGSEKSNLEIAEYLLDKLGKSTEMMSYVEDRKGHDFRYSVNFNKIAHELLYKPQTDFEVGMNETIRWYVNRVRSLGATKF